MEVGTLKELGVKVGDRVADAHGYEADVVIYKGKICVIYSDWDKPEERDTHDGYRIISRASDENPKTWGEMTDAEKGALLLAAHEGKEVEMRSHQGWYLFDLHDVLPYHVVRIKPEPNRETVTRYGSGQENWWLTGKQCSRGTHRITFDIIDGEPDVDSVRMEEI